MSPHADFKFAPVLCRFSHSDVACTYFVWYIEAAGSLKSEQIEWLWFDFRCGLWGYFRGLLPGVAVATHPAHRTAHHFRGLLPGVAGRTCDRRFLPENAGGLTCRTRIACPVDMANRRFYAKNACLVPGMSGWPGGGHLRKSLYINDLSHKSTAWWGGGGGHGHPRPPEGGRRGFLLLTPASCLLHSDTPNLRNGRRAFLPIYCGIN